MPFPFGAVATLVGGAINAGSALLANKRNNQANKQESELAYQRQRQAIAEQNSYNSPAEQVARLRAAGLNPNLAYGADGAAVGNQDATPEYLPASYQSGIAPASSGASEMINSLIGLREQHNKNVLAESQALLNSNTIELQKSGIEINKANARVALEMLDWDKKIASIDYEIKQVSKDNILKEGKEIDQRIQNLLANEDLLKAQTGLTRSQALNMDVNSLIAMLLFPSQKAMYEANASQARAYAEKAYQEAMYVSKYYELQARQTSVSEGGLEFAWSQLIQNKNLTDLERNQIRELTQKQINQGYWRLGVDSFLRVAEIGAQLANPTVTANTALGQAQTAMYKSLSEYYGPGVPSTPIGFPTQ